MARMVFGKEMKDGKHEGLTKKKHEGKRRKEHEGKKHEGERKK